MRLAARLSTVLVVGVLVTVIGLAAGRALTAVRQTPEPSFEPFAPPPAASSNGTLALPVQCDASTALAGRFANFAWSPDSSVLAATSAPSGESLERITLFYGPGWKAHDIGPGRGPRWSPAGVLAFERPDRAGTLRVVDPHSGQQVAQIDNTSAAYAWDGEALVFFRGNELRAWHDGKDELRAVVGSSYVPSKPYLARFSGDSSRFVVERRENGKIAELFIGDTKDGRASPLAPPLAYSLAPFGGRVMFDYDDRLTLFAEARASATVMKTEIAGTFTGWSPDSRRALFRTSSSALLGWDVMRVDEVARTTGGSAGDVAFAPNGRWLASFSSGSLSVAPCADRAADPRVKLTRDKAIQLVRSRPDVLGVTKIEAKLVLWAELERNKTRFITFGTADTSAPVWLVGLAGEVRRPPNWNPPVGAPETYPLGLYALDATDGHELAMTITIGTWWIGDGFDDLHEYGTLPPAWTPPTSPYPTPVVPVDYTVTAQGQSAVVKSEGGWSIPVPRVWIVPRDDDTMLVVHALPFDSTALGNAERALATLQLASPAAAPRATVTKDAAIAIVTAPLIGARSTKPVPIARIDRAEARLVRWTDIRSIVGPFQGPGPGPLSAEPQAPIWVVAVAGDLGMTSGICRGLTACPSPAPIRWSVSFVDARTGAVRWTQSAGAGDWPAFFDALPDQPF